MLETQSEPGDFTQLAQLIRDIRVGLLTTVDRDGQFHTRPVETLRVENDLALWFFTDWGSAKVEELRRDVRVSLGYSDAAQRRYVAISGAASIFRDVEKARELWTIEQRAYYPQGPEDERLALLRVGVERAEYWIAPGRVSYLLAALKAAVSGTPVSVIGENRKLTP